MMIFDFQCTNSLCKDYHVVFELVVRDSLENPECGLCLEPLDKVLSYAMARVKGGTPVFHR